MTKVFANIIFHALEQSEPIHYQIVIEKANLCLSDLISEIAGTEWGKPLFTQDSNGYHLRHGYFLVLDDTAVQSWDIPNTPISSNVTLKIVPFIAGG